MNRLILIGNGFDLAHGLKTDYKNFVEDLVFSSFSKAMKSNFHEEPNVFKIYKNPHYSLSIAGNDLAYFTEHLTRQYKESDFAMFASKSKVFQWICENLFIERIVTECSSKNWVDIENEYYRQLKRVQRLNVDEDRQSKELKSLSRSLAGVSKCLETYLSNQKCTNLVRGYPKLFMQEFGEDDFVDYTPAKGEKPNRVLLLNFNYTDTVSKHLRICWESRSSEDIFSIDIHGRLNTPANPIIFGYGDEMDEDYKALEHANSKGYLDHVKSLAYNFNSNYRDLLRFIDSEEFQVYVFGHSCGLSDRTMLNMIFEHLKCASIKVFYHKTADGDNYRELTEEIIRHFRIKQDFRRKVVSKDRSEPMPQLSKSDQK